MKKWISTGLMFLLCIGLLSGCSKKYDVENSTVFVEKKGNIISVDVEEMDRDYYDEAELKEYIDNHITDYTEENGKTVKMESFQVKEETAKLVMEYDSYEDFTKFNGVELYSGTVVKAMAEGYDFDTEFSSISDDNELKSASKKDVLEDDDNKVVIIKANVDVTVDGTILFVSTQNVKVTGKNSVSITGEGSSEEAAFTYIIYQ